MLTSFVSWGSGGRDRVKRDFWLSTRGSLSQGSVSLNHKAHRDYFFFFLAAQHCLWDFSSFEKGSNPCLLKWKHAVLTTGPPSTVDLVIFRHTLQYIVSESYRKSATWFWHCHWISCGATWLANSRDTFSSTCSTKITPYILYITK